MHYTTHEYFDKECLHLFEDAEVDVSRSCLSYLSYNAGLETTTWHEDTADLIATEACQSYPFLEYASQYWFLHVSYCLQTESPAPVLLKVVARSKSSGSISVSISLLCRLLDRKENTFPLAFASLVGLRELMTILLDKRTGTCPVLDIPLLLTSRMDSLTVVDLLLQ